MGYQQGSIDISHLQAIALDDHDAAVNGGSKSLRVRGSQKPSPSSLHSFHVRATTATSNFAGTSAQTNNSTKSWDAMQTQEFKDISLRTSQVNLSTMVVSNAPMHSDGTPSDGDTQKAPDWDDYCEQAMRSKKSDPVHTNEEETGQINITDGLEPDLPTEEDSALHHDENHDKKDDESDDENDDGNDEDVHLVSQDGVVEDIRAEPFPESRRFQQPRTPQVTGAKRKRPVDEETPHLSTPRLPINPFAGLSASNMMRPSQIFHATQAQTSPLLVHSDTLSERPSPNINTFGRPSTAGSISSPIARKDPRSFMARAVTEPQGNYVSMKESQDARERRRKRMSVVEIDLFDNEFEQQAHSQPGCGIGCERRVPSFGNEIPKKRSPSVPTHPIDKDGKATSLLGWSVRQTGNQQSPVVLTSDATPPPDGSGNITEDETEREEEKEETPISAKTNGHTEDNKENVEVPMTGPRHHGQMVTSQSSPSSNRIRKGQKRTVAQSATQVARTPRRTTSLPGEQPFESSTQPYVVRDSQSSQQHHSHSLPAPYPPNSSLENPKVIPQSQISQKSKSSVPQSSIPSKAEASNREVALIQSSPLQASEPRGLISPVSGALAGEPSNVRAERSGNNCASTDIERDACGPSTRTEQDLSSTELQSNGRTKSQLPASIKSTIPETNLVAQGNAPLPQPEANSSQDMSSPGPVASPTSRLTTNQSTGGHSLGTTLFETAQDHLSPSNPDNQVQRFQNSHGGDSKALLLKKFQRKTFFENIPEPSSPDGVENAKISDHELISKDDEEYMVIMGGKPQPNAIHERQEDEEIINLSPEAVQLVASHGRRLATTSTKWKDSTSDPPSFDQPGSPTRPTSSAVSRVSQNQPSSEAELSSSSPLSPPPASDHEERLSSFASKTAPITLGYHTVESNNALGSDSIAEIPSRSKETSPRNRLTYQEDLIFQEAEPEAIQNKELQNAHRFSSDLPVVASDRVFAHFNGKSSFFYTATCLGVIPGDEPRYSVRYDDGAEACISAFGIKRLEFRPGDVVKVDLQDYRNKSFRVVGVAGRQKVQDLNTIARLRKNDPDDTRGWPETDIYGHTKVLLVPKRGQNAASAHEDGGQTAVGMYDLYITQSMWANIKDREYVHVGRKLRASEGAQMGKDSPSAPSSPSSRAKRLKATTLIQSTHTNGSKQGLFSRMVFTLTNISQPTELERTRSLILAHGGKVLDEGFDALFHVPVLHRITSPKKSDSDRDFHPTREAQGLGFTCLIADKHCRRAKYIQALALGIPCLATRWISDCVTKQRLLPWSAYILPAGDSAFLGGATHSRVLPIWPSETTPLSKLFDQRPQLLKGSSILLIMSKNEEESMRQYPLLTFALSPVRVARALSMESAARAVAEAQAVGEPWDWVFSYDREREVAKLLFGSTAHKRKVRGMNGGQDVRTRVIGNEFVIQSLISGQLLEE